MAHTSSFRLILLLFGIYLNIVGYNFAAKSGPFISTLVRAEKCSNPTLPYQKDPSCNASVQLYKMGKKSLLRGNFTSIKPDSGIKLRVEDNFYMNDKWQLTFIIESMTCRGRIAAMLGNIFNIKFNRKTCMAPKGVYAFNSIDYDFVDHVFFITREYGRVLRKVEAFSKKGTLVCVELESVITPKKK